MCLAGSFLLFHFMLRAAAIGFTASLLLIGGGMAAGNGLPDGGVLAFSVPVDPISEWHIMVMDVRRRLRVTVAEYGWRLAVGLSWSPDGQRIAFATYSPRSDIFVVDVYSGEVYNLTDDWADDRYPTWSPDGQHIAFYTNRDRLLSTRYEVYVRPSTPDPTNSQRMTFDEALYPAWSPDGAQLVYSSRLSGDLYRMDTACIRLQSTCNPPMPIGGTRFDDRNPVWSPDGQHIAFISFLDASGSTGDQIFITNASGSSESRLLASGWRFQGMPSWSPDGKLLAFVGKAQSERSDNLYITSIDGGIPRKLAEDAYYAYNERWPMWSPDGRFIAFSHRHSGGLFLVEVASGRIEKLSDLPAIYPVWQPVR